MRKQTILKPNPVTALVRGRQMRRRQQETKLRAKRLQGARAWRCLQSTRPVCRRSDHPQAGLRTEGQRRDHST